MIPAPYQAEAPAREPDADEEEFIRAMDQFKRASGRQFPTWSDALGVARRLGYRKPDPASDPA